MAPRKTKPDVKAQVAAAAAGTDVATQGKPRTMHEQMALMVPEFARAMPKHMDPDRLARIALTEFRNNPALASCTPESFFGALMQAATLGCEPGLLGHAYLVPFKNRKTQTTECQFMLGYRGMLDLARRSGEIIGSPKARIVYENDDYNFDYGLMEDNFKHVPWYMREDEQFTEGGKVRGAYVITRLKAGSADFFFMPIHEVEARRKRSMARDNGPWKTDYDAMVLKTAVRGAFKFMPTSVEIQQAQAVDGNVTSIDRATLEVSVADLSGEVLDVDTSTGEIIEDAPVAEPEEQAPEEAGAEGHGEPGGEDKPALNLT